MELQLKNTIEPLVSAKLDDIMEKCECCKCEKCRMDILSYALNKLPAKYVVTFSGSVYAKLESCYLQNETDVLAAIMAGIKLVKANPKHDGFVK